MESFTIQCTSCESRIRVRNPNMIGQVANCPKCGSMILIAAPQKITVESGNPTDSVAVTRESLPVPDASVLNSSPSVFETGFRIEGIEGLPTSHSQNVDLAHSVPDDEYRIAPDPEPEDKSSDALPLGAWMPEPAASDPLPPPRAADIDSSIQAVRAKRQESAAKSRHLMLVATLGLCSVLIAIGILVVFVRWIAKPNEVAKDKPADKPPAVANKPLDNGPLPPDSLMNEGLPQNAQPVPGGNENPLANNASDTTGASNGDPLAASPSATNPSGTAPGDIPNSDSPKVDGAPAKPEAQVGPSTMGNATAPKNPLGGSIAPSLDSVLGSNDPASPPTGDAPLELPPGLQGFSKLFNQGFEPAMNDSALPLEQATELPENGDKAPANQPVAPPAADLVPATVDKLLNTQLAGLLINERPLSEALTTMSLVSDIPIVPDVDSLLAVGASKSTVVRLKATSPLTIDAALKALASSTKISLVPWENRVVYARASDEELEARVPAVLPIADLVSDEAQRDALLQGLKEVLPELSDAIAVNEGELQLTLTQGNRLICFQLARLLETWRVARGVVNEASSAVVPKNCLLPEWPVAAMQQAAKTPIKQIVPAEPIARSWQRLAADARVLCWVDWYGLQMGETNPRSRATVITAGRPLGDILQHYANKYQVVFAIEDARSIWVTSPEFHRLQPRLFVLPLSAKSLEEWTAELEPLSPLDPTTGASMLKLAPTPDGQYLFVRCCRPILVEPN